MMYKTGGQRNRMQKPEREREREKNEGRRTTIATLSINNTEEDGGEVGNIRQRTTKG
jgi:hypothetical protein